LGGTKGTGAPPGSQGYDYAPHNGANGISGEDGIAGDDGVGGDSGSPNLEPAMALLPSRMLMARIATLTSGSG
jgi:hypothetical protein